MKKKVRVEVQVTGIVQGVGFRPFIYRLAHELNLTGWVYNNCLGAVIEVQGIKTDVIWFLHRIREEAPIGAYIDKIISKDRKEIEQEEDFLIVPSEAIGEGTVFVAPDFGICKECMEELFDKNNRRFEYPFLNCTNCGPRFSIIKEIPYDRTYTVMSEFLMCKLCKEEYHTPWNRRFHAQPTACPSCGPKVKVIKQTGEEAFNLEDIRTQLKQGACMALKGIGGYQLICNARDKKSVARLRDLKGRDEKPFALMARDMEAIKEVCEVSEEEGRLLKSSIRPIVLLRKKEVAFSHISKTSTLGMMLPAAPLQCLLFDHELSILVATSANHTSEPMIYDDKALGVWLQEGVDVIVTHNREIYAPVDDSIIKIVNDTAITLRCARGMIPMQGDLSFLGEHSMDLLACGAELKNSFCFVTGNGYILGPYIGDLTSKEMYERYLFFIEHFKRLYRIKSLVYVSDMHPQYISSQYAREEGSQEVIQVQHHHAHIASCMVEHRLVEPVIGIAFDGTGYGEDGHIWGGEFFVGTYESFRRFAHLEYIKMPGGDLCIKQPWRMLQSYLQSYKIHSIEAPSYLIKQIEGNVNCPLTSSVGRLFDAVAVLLDLCKEPKYEAQAAILLEEKAKEWREERAKECREEVEPFPYEIIADKEPYSICLKELFQAMIACKKQGKPIAYIAARFHETLVEMCVMICCRIRKETLLNQVVLSGGVFQNEYLLKRLKERLQTQGFVCFNNEKIPTNDGGISVGQSAIAYVRGRSDVSCSHRKDY